MPRVTSVSFNRFHDQLLLTASTDCQVNLQSIVSVSSAPVAESQDDGSSKKDSELEEEYGKPVDGLVQKYDQHEDSVYSVAWSTADPWIFASLSYDGRLVVNRVPNQHKYKIIL
jgi:hypothetical protein